MIALVLLGRDELLLVVIQRARKIVFQVRDHHAAALLYVDADAALGRVFDLLHRLDRVVDRVAEQRIDVRRFHERKALPVHYAVEQNALVLAEKGLFGEQDVQRFVARLYARIVDGDGAFHLGDLVVGQVFFVAEERDHLFEVVALDVDQVHHLLGGLHLSLLQVQNVFHEIVFLADVRTQVDRIQRAERKETAREVKAREYEIHRAADPSAVFLEQLLQKDADHHHAAAQKERRGALHILRKLVDTPSNDKIARRIHEKDDRDIQNRDGKDTHRIEEKMTAGVADLKGDVLGKARADGGIQGAANGNVKQKPDGKNTETVENDVLDALRPCIEFGNGVAQIGEEKHHCNAQQEPKQEILSVLEAESEQCKGEKQLEDKAVSEKKVVDYLDKLEDADHSDPDDTDDDLDFDFECTIPNVSNILTLVNEVMEFDAKNVSIFDNIDECAKNGLLLDITDLVKESSISMKDYISILEDTYAKSKDPIVRTAITSSLGTINEGLDLPPCRSIIAADIANKALLEASYNIVHEKFSLNTVKLALQNAKAKLKDLSTKEKSMWQAVDAQGSGFIKSIEKALTSDRREAIIKGNIIPSFSKCIKGAIALAGVGLLFGPMGAIITALGGLGVSKMLNAREKKLIYDEIDTELKVVEKQLEIAQNDGDMNQYRFLLNYQKKLTREAQRIRYGLKVQGRDIPAAVLPGRGGGKD